MDYSKLSDFEINKRVAKIYGGFALTLTVHNEPPSGKSFDPGRFDPCNNPFDAWPIIIDNQLSLNNYGDSWEASFEHDEPVGAFGTDECVTSGVEDKNPLRALMIAFLMKVETKNAKIPSERDS